MARPESPQGRQSPRAPPVPSNVFELPKPHADLRPLRRRRST